MADPVNAAPTNGYVANPVFNALVPSEGPRIVTVAFDFTAAKAYFVDFQYLTQSGQMRCIASCFVDNSQNGSELLITVQGTSQPLKVPANSQGTFPLYCLAIPRITLATAGSGLVTVLFSNSTQPLAVWGGLT